MTRRRYMPATLVEGVVRDVYPSDLDELRGLSPSEQPPRPARLVTAAALDVVVVVGSVLWLGRQNESRVETTSDVPTLEPSSKDADAAVGSDSMVAVPLTRLTIDTNAFGVAVSLVAPSSIETEPPTVSGSHLQTFRESSDRLDGPTVWTETDPDGSDFIRSGLAPASALDTIIVDGVEFYVLASSPGGSEFLVGDGPNGIAVTVAGVGVELTDLIEFAKRMNKPGSNQSGWTVTEPTLGLRQVFEGYRRDPETRVRPTEQIAAWETGQGGRIELLVRGGGQAQFEHVLFQQARRASSISTHAISTGSAVVVSHRAEGAAIWRDTENSVAEMHLVDTEFPITDVLDALKRITESEWLALRPNISAVTTNTVRPLR